MVNRYIGTLVLSWRHLFVRCLLFILGFRKGKGRLRGLAVACWTRDHYHPCSNLWRLFRPWHRLIIFGGRSAHLAYLVHKSGRKTSIIIIIIIERGGGCLSCPSRCIRIPPDRTWWLRVWVTLCAFYGSMRCMLHWQLRWVLGEDRSDSGGNNTVQCLRTGLAGSGAIETCIISPSMHKSGRKSTSTRTATKQR